jgi:hypothetical protein
MDGFSQDIDQEPDYDTTKGPEAGIKFKVVCPDGSYDDIRYSDLETAEANLNPDSGTDQDCQIDQEIE